MPLYLFVEGPDDIRFCEGVIIPQLRTSYQDIRTIDYAQTPPVEIRKLVRSVKRTGDPYMLLADKNAAPCITKRKEVLVSKYCELDGESIHIVAYEIESWYLAGVSSEVERAHRVHVPTNTAGISKEQFDRLIPKNMQSRVDWLREVLKHFSVELAKRRNPSFNRFAVRHGF